MRVAIKLWFVVCVSLFCATAWGRDFTFFVWSDTHFGAFDYTDQTRLAIIDQMNSLAGRKYPAGVFDNETVAKPAFVMHLGDITEHGFESEWNDPNIADQRSYFQTIKRLTATKKVYEVIGNHDSRIGGTVREHFAERWGGTYYSFDMEGVHFVVLDAYPWHNTASPDIDDKQFEWLKDDLAKVKGQEPIIIAMHVQPNGNRDTNRTSKPSVETSERLRQILDGRNIVAFLHGHWHIVKRTKWLDYDVLAPAGFGYLRRGCAKGEPIFGVVRITDGEMTVCSYDWDKGEFLSEPSLRESF